MKEPNYLVTAEEMRALDARAIEEYGIPGVVLMENAGRSTFHILSEYLDGKVKGLRVAVVTGPGNNGGDGYVVARYLINHGAEVKTFLLSTRDKIRGDALVNLQTLEKMTPHVIPVTDSESFDRASSYWKESDVVVDAILGTGLNSEVRSPYREAILAINKAPGLTISIDIPSGLDADSGRILGSAVKADLTAVYGFKKLGMALHPGIKFCGKISVVDISIPICATEKNPPKAVLYDEPDLSNYLEARSNTEAHKGTFGHVLIVGGSPGKTGAPVMAARSASRIGAGLVTVGVPSSLNPILEVKLTEEMTEPLPETVVPGYLGEAAADRILSLATGKQCLVLGPGLSTHEGISDVITRVLDSYSGWVVIDADGLNALAKNMSVLKRTEASVVLTPHPGEMARLVGGTSREVQQDRVGIARRTASEYGVWVILKGSRSLTASPEGTVFVNNSGNPWMASGGQGDVLSGILGGLLAQQIPPEDALPFGVYIHGLAADRLVQRNGPRPVPAGDVIEELTRVLGELGELHECGGHRIEQD
ncbi:MAG: NAD(P)H-hydrate dehydratase [Desulfomonile sp.]